MNIIIEIKGGSVSRVVCDGAPEGSAVFVLDDDLRRFDNGKPVIGIADFYQDDAAVAATVARFDAEPDDDLAVHGQDLLWGIGDDDRNVIKCPISGEECGKA